ncbi:MAG: hypothetical protein WC454_04785 [Phycisphaerae bacterium]
MTKQEQQKSLPKTKGKLHFASRIVWLAWTGFLLLLLAAGLFLQAPWKVTALVSVFLLAATILPGVYRKWFWAVSGCMAAAVIIWVFLPDDNKGWRPYTFDKELAALQAKYTIPDEENAAAIYNELLQNYDPNSLLGDLPNSELAKLPMRKPWLSNEHPEIAEWLKEHRKTINTLLNASAIEQCRFPISFDATNMNGLIYRLGMMKKWAHLLISSANNDMAEGRTHQAFEKYIAALRIGKHQQQQPSLIDFLVGSSIETFSTNQLDRFIVEGDATEERLSITEQALAEIKHDWNSDLPKVLDYEKLLAKNFWGTFYSVNPEGETRLNPGALKWESRPYLPENRKNDPVETYWQERLMKASIVLRWFYMPSTPQKAGAIIDTVYEKYYPSYNRQKRPKGFSITSTKFNYRYMIEMQLYILEPFYHSTYRTYFTTLALQRGSRLIVALRRYKNKNGNWPGSLDEVKSPASEEIFVDPVNGGPFMYKLTDENFTLYSKGENNIDDEGLQDERTGADDLPIWSGEKILNRMRKQANVKQNEYLHNRTER